MGRRRFASRHLSAESDQDEIDQGEQGGPNAGGDQGVVGTEVGLRIERRWVGFLGHFGRLGQADASVCEADHIGWIFFTASSSGTAWLGRDW